MLRKGLAALMMGVICAGGVFADESASEKPQTAQRPGVVGWLKQKTSSGFGASRSSRKSEEGGAVQRAVVDDAERQAAQKQVRQTASSPNDEIVFVQEQPMAIEQVPAVPNMSTVSGPQYFSATGDQFTNPVPVHPGNNWQQYSPPVPVHVTSGAQFSPISRSNAGQPVMTNPVGTTIPQNLGTYPQTGAALYPAPVPGIPQQIGGTVIPNQAFHPHEMLYAHRYRAMYPPYYYKVNGGWVVTPFGVWSHEDWKLQGTMVDVKYKSHISPFSLFHGPKGW
ncbi:MAG: hypothetical protein JNL58_25035 [Planctomyces sp.]|nr:hypothetical protein [Planctomyces sp.]